MPRDKVGVKKRFELNMKMYVKNSSTPLTAQDVAKKFNKSFMYAKGILENLVKKKYIKKFKLADRTFYQAI